MAQLGSIVQYLAQLLDPASFHDSSYNGLQVDSGVETIKKVAFAVDGGLSVIEKAVRLKSQLLIVHHGILWGSESAVNGNHGRRVRALIKGGCSLYGSHLPLDANWEVGNNAELARLFELSEWEPFCHHENRSIGIKGITPSPKKLDYFISLAKQLHGAQEPFVLPFGKTSIEKVGIVSGGGSFALYPAAEEGLDLLITGEPRQEAYHLAKETGMNVIFAGHYATETVGVLALKDRMEKDLGISAVFIEEVTGI